MRIDTAKGKWGVFVEHVVETQGGRSVMVKVILEQTIDDEHFLMRNLGLVMDAEVARNPDSCPAVARRIRQWIESYEGDGFVDMSTQPA